MEFIHFSNVDIEKAESWKCKSVLTLDVDWASDEQLNFVIDLLQKNNIKATFFITHETEVINRLRNNDLFELGIHPNFNPLLIEKGNKKNAEEILNDLLEIVPEAKVVRSHSMTHSGHLLNLFGKYNLKFSSQFFLNKQKNIYPVKHINGIIDLPVYFADDGFIYEVDKQVVKINDYKKFICSNKDSIRVFNFHPVHIFYNTDSFSTYNELKNKGITNILRPEIGVNTIFKSAIGID